MMLPTIDAYAPREIAHKIEAVGVTKARSDTLSLLVLAVLAGAFIALGALFFTVVVTRSTLGFGVSRLVGGVAFSLGLILVIVGGAELFTGNNLVAMAWASAGLPAPNSSATGYLSMGATLLVPLAPWCWSAWDRWRNLETGRYARRCWPLGGTRWPWGWGRHWPWGCSAMAWSAWPSGGHGGTQRGRQGGGDCLSDHGICDHGL